MAPGNALPLHGNEKTMNLNSLVLANIQASPYFKVHLYELKTYHQVIDEIYYKVNHLEPWEKGSRKTAGQTGMCGGVRGVGTGGIVSSAYCLLYKLYTLKLTRKQLIGLCSHSDSSFIRALGLMYIRYTQPPNTFWEWYEPYLDDDEEVDPKAGGGNNMTIGEMSEQLLVKLEWYGTLFPRIPVPVQKDIENKLRMHKEQRGNMARQARLNPERDCDDARGVPGTGREGNDLNFGEAERMSRLADRGSAQRSLALQRSPKRERDASLPNVHQQRTYSRSRSRGKRSRSRDGRKRSRDRRERSRDRSREKRKEIRRRSRSGERKEKHKHKSNKHRSRSKNGSKERHKKSKRSSSRTRRDDRGDEGKRKKSGVKDDDFQRDLKREIERVKHSKNGTDRD